jgi:hypothetical protein
MCHFLGFFATSGGSNSVLQDLYNMFLTYKVAIYAHFLEAVFFFGLAFLTAFDALVPVFLTALPAARIGRSNRLPLSSTALRFSAGISLTREMIAVCVSSID